MKARRPHCRIKGAPALAARLVKRGVEANFATLRSILERAT
jgi:hypothetical protein